ncbi:ferredoxin [Nonomuraea wenchangensis]|uniref:Ferredoxin n=1 Tax=Nonomuraea wenchangensis TaxID=568860 RepID=A0A1I0LC70_9ACTN|nr:ferredoxin [Nonomuraea wenchangensis]SEU37431.1 Ferredoxin [Nonomuraea wenchangensis]
MRVSVDKDVCACTGTCALIAPEVFAIENHSELVVLDPEPVDDTLRDLVVDAAEQCPTGAIEITE